MNCLRVLSAAVGLSVAPLLLATMLPADDKGEKEGTAKLPAAADRKVDFVRDIQPLLAEHCYQCHGPKKSTSGLRLDRQADALNGGDGGKAILPGKSAESVLVHLVAGLDAERVMPPKGDRLTPEQIGVLRAWIDQGAVWPAEADAKVASGRDHWAYVAPVRPALPAVKQREWCRTPLDRFVLARLEAEGVKPSPELDRARLLRRVSLDLTGLLPTIAEVDAFVADPGPNAYERVVDRLLDSPAYGERWARMWLDLARYADSKGYEKDAGRTIWRYRDWVIGAFNRNLPFDQFSIEQLAGDMLPGATLDQKIATGFHRNTMNNSEGGTDDEEFRVSAVMDRVETTFGIWMATTFNCCQCHTHKYDPFTQREYYRFFAFLNQTADADRDDESPSIPAPTPEQAAKTESLQAEINRHEAIFKADTPELAAAQADWERTESEHLVPWTVLDPSTFTATSATLTKQDDKSLRAAGTVGETDTYTVTVNTDLKGITAIRLEAMPDGSLPKRGPGRAPNGNFVLTRLKVAVQPQECAADSKILALQNASADFEQKDFPASKAIDDDDKTGWAINDRTGRAHTAVFELKEPLGEAATQLTFTLEQLYGNKHTLGRFRLSVTNALPPIRVDSLPEAIRTVLMTAAGDRNESQRGELRAYFRSVTPMLQATRDRIAELKSQLPTIPTTLVMQELAKPRETRILVRGSYLNKGDAVDPGVPTVLHPYPADQPANRLGAARWVVSRDNPLTARVTVNRFWEQLFGRGLVETSEDFGTRGEKPSHPELLDWLAIEFMEPNFDFARSDDAADPSSPKSEIRNPKSTPWDVKRLLKLIVLSATYRQSPQATRELLERDPHNRVLARGPRFRMEAEMLRDEALAASGLLSRKQGGPSVMPPQPDGIWSIPYSGDKWVTSSGEDKYRRALYTFWRRSAPYPAFMTFDAPSREFCVLRRPRSNTPLQALTILNDPAYVEAAQALARRAVAEGGTTPAERATHIFRRCLSRLPSEAERNRLLALFAREHEHYRQDQSAAKEMATSHLGAPPEGSDLAELAAWTVVGNVVLNLDENLTK